MRWHNRVFRVDRNIFNNRILAIMLLSAWNLVQVTPSSTFLMELGNTDIDSNRHVYVYVCIGYAMHTMFMCCVSVAKFQLWNDAGSATWTKTQTFNIKYIINVYRIFLHWVYWEDFFFAVFKKKRKITMGKRGREREPEHSLNVESSGDA